MSFSRRRWPVVAVVCLLAAGCSRGREGSADGAAKMDTANAQWEDGLSAEQVQGEARAMSPEEAARAGLAVDTSIHLEQLDSSDSTGPGQPAQPVPGTADTTQNPGQPRGLRGTDANP